MKRSSPLIFSSLVNRYYRSTSGVSDYGVESGRKGNDVKVCAEAGTDWRKYRVLSISDGRQMRVWALVCLHSAQMKEREGGRELLRVSACHGGDEPERAQQERRGKGEKGMLFEAINQRCWCSKRADFV